MGCAAAVMPRCVQIGPNVWTLGEEFNWINTPPARLETDGQQFITTKLFPMAKIAQFAEKPCAATFNASFEASWKAWELFYFHFHEPHNLYVYFLSNWTHSTFSAQYFTPRVLRKPVFSFTNLIHHASHHTYFTQNHFTKSCSLYAHTSLSLLLSYQNALLMSFYSFAQEHRLCALFNLC